MSRLADVQVEDRGFLVGLTPGTRAGREWLHHNVDIEDAWRIGGTVWANAGPVRRTLDAMMQDGLIISEPSVTARTPSSSEGHDLGAVDVEGC